MIKFRNVTKLYGTVIGVNDITLDMPPGAYGLLGPNGSGKTTMINLIIGQLRPTIGQLRVWDRDPWRNDEMLRRIGVCPAIDPLFPSISGLEWTTYLVRLHGFSSSEAARRAESALDRMGMSHNMHRPMGSYSLGMRQRTKLAQAMAHDPEFLILDEPFNGLDPVARLEMIRQFRHWVDDQKSLLLASHVLHEVEAVRPSFLLISGGRLLASGSPAEVRAMLTNCPNTLHLKTNRPRDLAKQLMALPQVESVQIELEEGSVVVHSRRAGELYRQLASLQQDNGLIIHEMHSADESLQSLFVTLMQIHRGAMGRHGSTN